MKLFRHHQNVLGAGFVCAAFSVFAAGATSPSANAQTAAAIATDIMPTPITNVARQGEAGAPFINTWLLLGTFDNDAQNSGFNRDFIGETTAAPQDGQTTGGQAWRYFDDRLFSRNYDDYNDLFSYFSVKQKLSSAAKVVYAHSYVHSTTTQNVQLRVGADTAFKAWINGAPVAASVQAGPTTRILGENQPLNSGRDFVVVPVALKTGWNRLLLKVANVENGRFGFYARFTTPAGEAPRGLDYSVGGEGALTIENSAMPEAQTGALPIAWREWPYVAARPDIDKILQLGADVSDANGQRPAAIPGMGIGFKYNRGAGMSASPFKLSARGGRLPLAWSKSAGTLPSGMTLESDGTLGGTPTIGAKLGDYQFTAQVRDAAGQTATREYSLTLRERPNRAIEQGRLIGLIHAPQELSPAEVARQVQQMKRQGYSMGVPIMYHNGDRLFRWPTKFSPKQTPTDTAALYKKTLEEQGIAFGAYAGPFDDTNQKDFTVNQQGLVLQELLNGYAPKVLWFDWIGGDSVSLDSLFSIARSIDPNIVIIMNGSERMSNGDWDILNFEGWAAWGEYRAWNIWPANFPWPKKFAPSSWRYSVEPDWPLQTGITSDWREMLRVQLSLIGEGFIADIDHSSTGSMGAAVTVHKGAFATRPLVVQHENMANWTSRPNLPPLYEAFTQVDPGPLQAAPYGYNTINTTRDAIYLLALENRHGKTGLPLNAKVALGAIPVAVKSVTLMNTGAPLPFTQNATTRIVTLDTKNVAPDEVAHIVKIALQTPLSPAQAMAPPMASLAYGPPAPTSPIPAGNLASGKPAWLMSADGARELVPSLRYFAHYGVDGRSDTLSMAGGEWAWSYKIDLKRARTLRRIAVTFDKERYATEFAILTSLDGKAWTRVVEVAGSKSGRYDFNITPIEARWVRVQSLKPDGPDQIGYQMGIIELEAYENALAGVAVTPAPARQINLASGQAAQLLTLDATRELKPSNDSIASKGVDGNPATAAQASDQYPWTYHVDLGKTAMVRRIIINFAPGLWATQYNVFLSSDGNDWKNVVQVTGNDFNGAKSHTFAPVETRYVRVQAVKPDGPNQIGVQMAIAELQVFEN